MRFALWLLLLLALGGVLGVFIGDQFPTNVPGWPEKAAAKAGPILFPVLRFFELFDAMRSWWYRLLILLLSLSLFACVCKRTRVAWNLAWGTSFLNERATFTPFRQRTGFLLEGDGSLAPLAAPLRRQFFRVRSRETEKGGRLLYASRGGGSRFGPVLTHLGLLLLVVGGLFSTVFGLKTMVWLAPGDEINAVDPGFFPPVNAAEDFEVDPVPLGFTLRLDDFEIDRNEQGQVRQYLSTVTVCPAGGEPFQQVISVNHPLRLAGFNFYQASYEVSGSSAAALRVAFRDTAGATLAPSLAVELGQRFALPGAENAPPLEAVAKRFLGHAMVGDDGVYNASFELRNPAVLFRVFRGEQELWHQWSFAFFPEMHAGHSGHLNLVLEDFDLAYLTGLEVTRAPAGWVIWSGLGLCTLGLLLTFLIAHLQIWALAEPAGQGRWRVHVAARTNRDSSLFDRSFRRWVSAWQQSGRLTEDALPGPDGFRGEKE